METPTSLILIMPTPGGGEGGDNKGWWDKPASLFKGTDLNVLI